jgi:hypothetical protein
VEAVTVASPGRLASAIPYGDNEVCVTLFNSEGIYPEPKYKKVEDTTTEAAQRPVEDRTLYHLRRHIKYFYKKAWRQAGAALLLAILLVLGPPGNVGLVLLGGLLICGFLIYREYYGWQHFTLEVNLHEVIVHVPKNRWLFLTGSGGIRVFSRKVTSCIPLGYTFAEQWIFKEKCRSMTLDTEVQFDAQLHNMTDIKRPELLEEAYNELARHFGRV